MNFIYYYYNEPTKEKLKDDDCKIYLMKIKKYTLGHCVLKYGISNDVARRRKEHEKKTGYEFNVVYETPGYLKKELSYDIEFMIANSVWGRRECRELYKSQYPVYQAYHDVMNSYTEKVVVKSYVDMKFLIWYIDRIFHIFKNLSEVKNENKTKN